MVYIHRNLLLQDVQRPHLECSCLGLWCIEECPKDRLSRPSLLTSCRYSNKKKERQTERTVSFSPCLCPPFSFNPSFCLSPFPCLYFSVSASLSLCNAVSCSAFQYVSVFFAMSLGPSLGISLLLLLCLFLSPFSLSVSLSLSLSLCRSLSLFTSFVVLCLSVSRSFKEGHLAILSNGMGISLELRHLEASRCL